MIGIGSDHGGYELKMAVIDHLKAKGIECKDYGCYSLDSCDYPEFGRAAAKAVAESKKYSSNYRHMTDKGDMVASKSEVIIADTMFALGIDYEYEKEFQLANGRVVKPDFTIRKKDGSIALWEHVGLPDDPEYMAKHEWKVREYEKCGFTRSKNLILTFDKNGTLSTAEIRRAIELYELN